MACGGCARNRAAAKPSTANVDNRKPAPIGTVVGKSDNTDNKVKLRYYGGSVKKAAVGCSTCSGSKSAYTVTTSETIIFVSEDAPGGLYKVTFQIGHDYYVTEKQAEYLLTLTYTNRAGQLVHKFQKEP